MQLTPLAGYVFIEKTTPKEAQTSSGIIIASTGDEFEKWGGVVVAVAAFYRSNRGEEKPMTCKTGDHVVFKARSGDVFAIGDRTFYLVHEDDILATMDAETFQQLTPKTV